MSNDRIDDASRRVMLRAGLLTLAGAWIMGTKAQAQDKLTKQVAQYQDKPKDGHKCSICVNYVAPNQCKLVQGPISPDGWCIAFAPKSA